MRTGAAVGAGFRVLGEGDLDTLASPFRAKKRHWTATPQLKEAAN